MSEQIKKFCEFKHKELCDCLDENCITNHIFFDKAFGLFMEQKRYSGV